ncbi:MAG: M28 family peptidase [candidate division KSB1 bacterium]|nr:M28 family peptidase [candidate division KSB1 bacterium]MDZ7275848.1 M28 family peptidase [candidate division KSB1 bacterium]MDZ7287598.1 M28 family peptidase [candidate division KSB1 bacterium]MDZ7306498.1 M28 family peptidase [candidate division KSB1 bacterium]MDZ7350576.1 M28 family peptidase [candidate division KSB1 bacterium]
MTGKRLLGLALGLGLVAIALTMAVFFQQREPELIVPAFDGSRAYALLRQQCAFGPRVPGSAAHEQTAAFLIAELQKYADHVVTQSFEHTPPRLRQTVKLTNIIAGFRLQAGRRVLLCAHWDSRPWADEEPDSSRHQEPVLGANDGASGVAVLLEVARVLKGNPPPVGVDIVLFDGEDFGTPGDSRSYAIGAQHFARTKLAGYHPLFGILLDMVGDRELEIFQEGNSVRHARAVVDRVWNLASRLGVREFVPRLRHEVFDDHVPLLEAGVPVINIIDFDYPHWHTLADTPDKCSAASLEKVGRVVLAAVYHVE